MFDNESSIRLFIPVTKSLCEEGVILGSSDAIFVQLRSGFYIYAQETVGMVEMVLVAGDKNINSL